MHPYAVNKRDVLAEIRHGETVELSTEDHQDSKDPNNISRMFT